MMMQPLFTNNAVSALAHAVTADATTLHLARDSGARFPQPDAIEKQCFLLTLIGLDANGNENRWEIVQATARSGDALTVKRAQEGTEAKAWPAGTRAELRLTADGVNTLYTITNELVSRPTGGQRRCKIFRTSDVWVPPEGVEIVEVILVGGGGGGAGNSNFFTSPKIVRPCGKSGGNGGDTVFLGVVAQGGQGGQAAISNDNGFTRFSYGGRGGGAGGGKGGGDQNDFNAFSGKALTFFSQGGGGGGYFYPSAIGDGYPGQAGKYDPANGYAFNPGGGSWGNGGGVQPPGVGGGGIGPTGGSYGAVYAAGAGGGGGETVHMPVLFLSDATSIPVIIGAGGAGGAGYVYGNLRGDAGGDGGDGMIAVIWWE